MHGGYLPGSSLLQKTLTTRAFNVHPNPATDLLRIETSLNAGTTLFVYDVNGRVVMHQAIESNAVNIESLEAGLYLLELREPGGGKRFARFVKQ